MRLEFVVLSYFPGSVCSVKASGPSINSPPPATLTFGHISLACSVIWLGYETDHAAVIQSQFHSEARAHTLLIAPVTSYTPLFKCREFIWHFRSERWLIEQIRENSTAQAGTHTMNTGFNNLGKDGNKHFESASLIRRIQVCACRKNPV